MTSYHTFTDALRSYYNDVGEKYDTGQVSAHHQAGAAILVDSAGPAVKGGSWILDLATGTGNVAFAAAQKVGPSGRVLGIDLSDVFIKHAKSVATERGVDSYVDFTCQDVTHLALPSSYPESPSFDVVFCASAIMLFPDSVAVVRKVSKELLKQDGKFVANAYGSVLGALFFEIAIAQGVTTAMDPTWATKPGDALRKVFEDAGMEVEVTSTVQLENATKWEVGTSEARSKLWERMVVSAPWVSFGIDLVDGKMEELKAVWEEAVVSRSEADGFLYDNVTRYIAIAVNK